MSESQDTIEGSELLAYDSPSGYWQNLTNDNVKYLSGIIKTSINNRKSYLDATGESKNDTRFKLEEDDIKGLFSFRRSFSDLDLKYRLEIFDKIKNSGILTLVEQIGGMREFARKRFSSDEILRRICCK